MKPERWLGCAGSYSPVSVIIRRLQMKALMWEKAQGSVKVELASAVVWWVSAALMAGT
jgi:hypothetical protein